MEFMLKKRRSGRTCFFGLGGMKFVNCPLCALVSGAFPGVGCAGSAILPASPSPELTLFEASVCWLASGDAVGVDGLRVSPAAEDAGTGGRVSDGAGAAAAGDCV